MSVRSIPQKEQEAGKSEEQDRTTERDTEPKDGERYIYNKKEREGDMERDRERERGREGEGERRERDTQRER